MLVPSLVVLGDLLITRAQFPLSVLIDVVSLVLIFVAYPGIPPVACGQPIPCPGRW